MGRSRGIILLFSVLSVAAIILLGFWFDWSWVLLSNLGQFIGGIATASTLPFIIYSLITQQNEHETTVKTDIFNNLYSSLLESSDRILYPTTSDSQPTMKGVDALKFMADTYLKSTSLNNLKPLQDNKSSIEIFLNLFLSTLKMIESINNEELKNIFASLVKNKFKVYFGLIYDVENCDSNHIGLDVNVINAIKIFIDK
ncbi:MAG: hypothetical protein HQK52_16925 [Oligoflexia bacterium]|nr:hypothetical protein [Oligoflexia bacterium]